jgi:hypothetical protein
VAPHDGDRESRRELRRDVARTALFGCAVAFAVVAPLTRRGWVLLLDWAPGPRHIDSGFPAGPAFVLPVHALHAAFGAAVGWLPIAYALAIATAGAAVLVGGPWPARVVAGLAFAWNPFVFDRIATGQVALLVGYALLPWLTRAAVRAARPRDGLAIGAWWTLAALCSVHFVWIGGVIVAAAAVVQLRRVSARQVGAAVALAGVIVAAAVSIWLLAARPAAVPADPAALTTYRTVSDPDLGRSLGILAQQGFWRPVVTRPRDDLGAAFPFVACAVIAAAGVGLFAARRTRTARLAGTVVIAAGAGWVLAHGATGPFGFAYRAAYEHLPGFAVMREAQKWVALVSLATAVGLGCLATAIARRTRAGAWCLVCVPLLFAPTLAGGIAGRVAPARYPASWAAVRDGLDALPGPVAALPWEHYERAGITGDRVVANVGPAYFGTRVLVADAARDHGLRARISAVLSDARAAVNAGRPLQLGPHLAGLGLHGILVLGPDSDLPLERDPTLALAVSAPGAQLWVVRAGS